MRRPGRLLAGAVAAILGLGPRAALAQVSLADDIIIAAQGKENAERNRESTLGHKPGTQSSPYQRNPGTSDIMLGADPNRRLAPLPRLARRPVRPSTYSTPEQDRAETEHGLAPAIERLRLPGSGLPDPSNDIAREPDSEGPPGGLTLDAAIEQLVHANRDLRTKSLEIPQSDADALTASLRANPLLFYSSDGVPYGSYSPRQPGEINHGISIVLPFDFSGKRRTRIALARVEKKLVELQFQDAVRLAIDDLYTAFVDALAARNAVQTAERSLGLIDELLRSRSGRPPSTEQEQDDLDTLVIEWEVAAMSREDEHERYQKAKLRLGKLLDLAPEDAERLEVSGSIRFETPNLPPVDQLMLLAKRHRPDLAAQQMGIARARAELSHENSERFSDAYLLYTPFAYRDNSQTGDLSSTSWGAGLFVSAPLFNRNQGNIRRAALNLSQSQNEAAALEREVLAEVREADRELLNSAEDLRRLERVTLPAVRRKRDKARARLQAGQISADAFLAVQRDTTSLVRYYRDTLTRHRRNSLKLNTAVGLRLLP
jgi:cobalt-zinc-cadmium efflux system outer membrane protein